MPLIDKPKMIYVHPEEGIKQPRYIIIGEAPGANEEREGRPFVGQAGKFLKGALHGAGADLDECYFTNVVKVRPYKNQCPPKEVIDTWVQILQQEIFSYGYDNVKIFAFGGVAQYATNQIRDKFPDLQVFKHNYYGFYHPAYVSRFTKFKKQWLSDLKGAVDAKSAADHEQSER